MAFFRFPYTSFNQVNLDWIMRTLKKLEPAATLVEDAAATLEEAQQTAEAAQEAVDTVTTQAAEAVATAEEAKDIAEQAAQATVVDGSITRAKLATDVTDELDDLRTDVDAAKASAANALSAAGVAQQLGTQAVQSAAAAQASANDASTAAAAANANASLAGSAADTAQTAADAALAAVSGRLQVIHAADATTAGTTYDLSSATAWLIVSGHPSITTLAGLWIAFTTGTPGSNIKWLGGGPDLTITLSSAGILTITVPSGAASVWLMPLP